MAPMNGRSELNGGREASDIGDTSSICSLRANHAVQDSCFIRKGDAATSARCGLPAMAFQWVNHWTGDDVCHKASLRDGAVVTQPFHGQNPNRETPESVIRAVRGEPRPTQAWEGQRLTTHSVTRTKRTTAFDGARRDSPVFRYLSMPSKPRNG